MIQQALLDNPMLGEVTPVASPVKVQREFLDHGLARPSLPVKDRVQKLVAAKDPVSPCTDQLLVECLAAEPLKIARRTVSKYRRELRPPVNRHKRTDEVQR